jgi:hypothetical protein
MENKENNLLSSPVPLPNLTIDTNQIIYDTSYEVIYDDTKEYRKCIRHLFKMEHRVHDLNDDNDPIDNETLDEQNYDDLQTTVMLDYIYAVTKDNLCFQKLYDYAAATMFSQDREIGLAVMFSFDYFIFFHPCICSYLKMPHRMSEINEYFIELLNRFIK